MSAHASEYTEFRLRRPGESLAGRRAVEVAPMPAAPSPTIADCFEHHRGDVYRWAYALTRNHADALDLTQDVFVRLIEHNGPRAPEGVLRAWLRRVTHNLVIDRWRRRANQEHPLGDPPAAGDFAGQIESQEQAEHLRVALAGLSDQQRLVLLAKACDEMSFSSIAAELELAVSTVKTHYVRALEALRVRPEVRRLQRSQQP